MQGCCSAFESAGGSAVQSEEGRLGVEALPREGSWSDHSVACGRYRTVRCAEWRSARCRLRHWRSDFGALERGAPSAIAVDASTVYV